MVGRGAEAKRTLPTLENPEKPRSRSSLQSGPHPASQAHPVRACRRPRPGPGKPLWAAACHRNSRPGAPHPSPRAPSWLPQEAASLLATENGLARSRAQPDFSTADLSPTA